MRKWTYFFYDLVVMTLSPFIALFIRYDYAMAWYKADQVTIYAAIVVVVSAISFLALGTYRIVWRHISLPDFIKIIYAVTVAILVGLVLGFYLFRLDSIPRSTPIIQWAFALSVIVGTRLIARAQMRLPKSARLPKPGMKKEHVLVLGVNHVGELYLRCVTALAHDRIAVEGLLDEAPEAKGRLLYQHKVLGQPGELSKLLAKLRVHGVEITRIVVTTPFDELSESSRSVLKRWERSGAVELDLFEERLGFRPPSGEAEETGTAGPGQPNDPNGAGLDDPDEIRTDLSGGYAFMKRTIDIVGSLTLMIVLSPFIALATLLVLIDLGHPVIFWQLRPGRYGFPFRLFKFRTMRAKHDVRYGDRVSNNRADRDRITKIGRFLRRTRMDELPQLYHILVGEMSFVGPRPLLPAYQPENGRIRLSVRPGITGWAQVNGGDEISADEKLALDLWYLKRMSLAFDIKIVLKTLAVIFSGDKINRDIIEEAVQELEDIRNRLKYRSIERETVAEQVASNTSDMEWSLATREKMA